MSVALSFTQITTDFLTVIFFLKILIEHKLYVLPNEPVVIV